MRKLVPRFTRDDCSLIAVIGMKRIIIAHECLVSKIRRDAISNIQFIKFPKNKG
jgi:hypothetical protein